MANCPNSVNASRELGGSITLLSYRRDKRCRGYKNSSATHGSWYMVREVCLMPRHC